MEKAASSGGRLIETKDRLSRDRAGGRRHGVAAGESVQHECFDLAKLLGSMEPETFFRDFWEKKPLAVSRNDAAYYRGLFSLRDLDSLIAFTRPKFFDNLKPGAPSRHNVVHGRLPDEEPFAGYYPDLAEVHRAFAHGKTLLITGMQQRWPAVAAMGRHLEAFFGCHVHTNLYLTPPGAQGFDAHYDTHEVFVLQIDGDKHWRLYGALRDLPLPNEQAAVPKDQLGAATQEVLLRPGDLLYIPRGHVHEAFTSERASLHLTVGVNVVRWLNVLQRVLEAAGAADVRFRQSLPLGLLCADAPPPAVKERFQELLQLVVNMADLEGALGAMTAGFLGKLAALPQDYFAMDDPERINLDTLVERAAGVICRVVREGDQVVLQAPGARIDGPASIAPALHFIARTRRFTPAALPDDLSADAKLALIRRLLREKLLTVVRQSANAAAEILNHGPE
jgi:ribosomal protein L16 Arg81 hydroxylase